VYANDFDPRRSNVEFAAYQFLHVERMGLLQQIVPALAGNLSYWLALGDAEIAEFKRGCEQSRRPDASGYQALAQALDWIRTLHHETLKPMAVATTEPLLTIPNTGVIVPQSRKQSLEALVQQWTAAAERVAASHYAGHAARTLNHAREIGLWLANERPRLLVTGAAGTILWDPDRPDDLEPVMRALEQITDSAAPSLLRDLALIDERTRHFLDSLRAPDALPAPHADTAQNGLCYLHIARKLLAYNLREGRMQRLREPAPPYERWMLAARSIHEWAHLAVDAGWVTVAPANASDHARRRADLAALYDELVAGAPAHVRAHTQPDLARLAQGAATGAALADFTLARMPDYQANLLARRYLTAGESQTYVRNNVASLALDYPATQLYQRLARYVFEAQYLRLAEIADPLAYLVSSTWLAEQYLQTGVIARPDLERLFDLTGALCTDHQIDEDKFA